MTQKIHWALQLGNCWSNSLGSVQAPMCLSWQSPTFLSIKSQMSTNIQTDRLLHRLSWPPGWEEQALLHLGAGPPTTFRHPSCSSSFTSHSGILQYKSSFGKISIFSQVKQKQNSSKNYILAILYCFYHNMVRYICSDHLCISNIPEQQPQFFCL